MKQQTILVTGVAGYVGGRLVPRLLEAGYAVRVLVRSHAGAMLHNSQSYRGRDR